MKIEINNGVVTNDGAKLGTIQDGTCHLTQKCAPSIKGEIRKVAANPDLQFVVGEAPDSEDGPEGSDNPGSGPDGHGLTVEKVIHARNLIAESKRDSASNPHDPKPERDPIRGDKCPNLIAWKLRQKGGK